MKYFKECLIFALSKFSKADEIAEVSYLGFNEKIFRKFSFPSPSFISFTSAGAIEYTDCFSAEGKTPQRVSWIWHKQSVSEVPVMLELWGMRSTPLLPSLPNSLCLGVVAPDKGPVYGVNRTKPWFECTVFFVFLGGVGI